MIEVRTQAELDKALESEAARDGEELIVILGDGRFEVSEGTPWLRTSASPTVVTRGTSNATVETRGTSNARVVTWGTSNATVVTRGTSNARVVTWGTSNATVVTRGTSNATVVTRETSNATVVTRGTSNATVVTRETSNATVVTRETSNARGAVGKWSHLCATRRDDSVIAIPGAVPLDPPEVRTASDWLDYYGIEVKEGVAVLYKAVGDGYISSRNFAYKPGTEPSCTDWNPDPGLSCGSGLHFCPAPSVALCYRRDATKFVACPVAVSEIVLSHTYGDQIPDKVRAPRVAGPIVECDIDGEPVGGQEAVDA